MVQLNGINPKFELPREKPRLSCVQERTPWSCYAVGDGGTILYDQDDQPLTAVTSPSKSAGYQSRFSSDFFDEVLQDSFARLVLFVPSLWVKLDAVQGFLFMFHCFIFRVLRPRNSYELWR